MLTFGVTVLPDPPYQRLLDLLELAERHGFEYGWTYDSHVLWQETIPLLAIAARQTSRIKLGHFVTNPATREPTVLASAYATLQDVSDGRIVMGIGRGDSAVRYIGSKPMRIAEFERACSDGPRVHERPRGRVEREGAAAQVGAGGAAGDPALGRGLRPEGARRRRPRRRRRDRPARRPGDHPVDRWRPPAAPPRRPAATRRS